MSHLEEGQLHELLDGELDAPARAAALAHLATCDRCKAAYDEAAGFLAQSDALIEMVQVPSRVEGRKSEVVSRQSSVDNPPPTLEPGLSASDARRKRRLTTFRTLAWAASIVVAVGIGWYGSDLSRSPSVGEAITAGRASPAADRAAPVVSEPLPSPAAPLEARADTEVASADRATRRQLQPTPATPAPTTDKSGPDDALAAASSEATATLAEEPKAEASGMMVQRDAPALAPAPPSGFAPLAARDERARRENDQGVSAGRLAGAAVTAKQSAPTTFRVVGMEEAVRILGGSIRLIDGLTPTRVMAGRVGGEDRAATVRVVYEDPPGRELWLDQRREVSTRDGRADDATALLPGDTLMVVREQGVRSLNWVDQSGFLLRLTGYIPADSLQRLQAQVR